MHVQRAPSLRLSPYVERLWAVDDDGPAGARERLLPTAAFQLIAWLGGEPMRSYDAESGLATGVERRLVLVGARSRPALIGAGGQRRLAGVAFRPGGISAFLPTGAHDLAERDTVLEDVVGHEARGLHDALIAATDTGARLRLLEGWLLRRMAAGPSIHPAVEHALTVIQGRAGSVGLSGIWQPLSDRHLERLFRQQVGIPPKRYARVVRLHAAAERLRAGGGRDTAAVAVDLGYYDQSHLDRDFRTLAGLTPSQYRQGVGPYPNHVPVA